MNRITRNLLAFFGGAVGIIAIVLMMAPTGGFPSRPRFQSVTVGNGTRANTAQEVRINASGQLGFRVGGIRPILKFEETEQAADNRIWYTQTDGLFFTIRAVDDAEASAVNPLVIKRSGITIPSIQLTATNIQQNGVVSISSGATGNAAVFNNTHASGPYITWSRSSTPFGDIGNAPQIFSGGAVDDFAIGTRGTGDFVVATGSTATERLRISDTGVSTLGGVAIPRQTVTETAISGAGMLVGDTITISKAAATSRANNAVDSNDPDLQITALPAGHYLVDFQVNLNAGAGGARYRLEAPTASNTLYGINNCASTVTAVNGSFDGLVTCAGTLRASSQGASAKVQATGTVAISWAQNSSDAANTTLEPDSYLRVTRVD